MWDELRILFFFFLQVLGDKRKALEICLQTFSSPHGLPETRQTLPEMLTQSGPQLEYLMGGGVGEYLLSRLLISAILYHRMKGHTWLSFSPVGVPLITWMIQSSSHCWRPTSLLCALGPCFPVDCSPSTPLICWDLDCPLRISPGEATHSSIFHALWNWEGGWHTPGFFLTFIDITLSP